MDGVHAYILANGQSRRFNHDTKALKTLAGKYIIEHVIDRLKPQATSITINSSNPNYKELGLDMMDDLTTPFSGPIAGLYSCMAHFTEYTQNHWLLLSACDTPFIPTDLTATLLNKINNAKAACIRYEGFLQPTFSIWHRDLLPELKEAAVEKNIKGFKPFIEALGDRAAIVDYPPKPYPEPNPFFNINTPANLAEAEKQIHHEQRH